jgi:Family of unknown function (DUF6807)
MTVRIAALRSRRIRVYEEGRMLAAYTIGEWRPYVYPLLTPSGVAVTDEAPADHPYNQSLWLSHHDVNGHTFWIDGEPAGKITGPLPAATVERLPDGAAAVLRHELVWQDPQGSPLLHERRVTAITPARSATLVDVLSERRPAAGPVTFGATKEAGFGIRIHDSLNQDAGGTLVNDRGRSGEAETFDHDADWIDYWGQPGDHAAGLALFPHPENPRHPWFTRAYGIVLANHHRTRSQTLQPGERLRLSWRVAAHDGSTEAADVPALYQEYLDALSAGLLATLATAPAAR